MTNYIPGKMCVYVCIQTHTYVCVYPSMTYVHSHLPYKQPLQETKHINHMPSPRTLI